MDSTEFRKDISQVLLVNEFLDVFSEEHSSMSLDRDMEFFIEVALGTAPISCALYRMVPLEIKENDLNLCQRRWMELLKDYDFTTEYHLGKPNLVADTLSSKIMAALASLQANVRMKDHRSLLAELTDRPIFFYHILEQHQKRVKCDEYKMQMMSSKATNFTLGKDGKL
ncbi:integrase [Gossypium australe]|uniref:Integrase n=1 Tax=Gossypium australe TaxID=47621 RepID=A0A5B6VL19_9ROSI|nr:integrase [Gossypium australe]